MTPRMLAMILAGGERHRRLGTCEGQRMQARALAARFRVGDFVLSNFLNFGIQAIYLLVRYRSQSLIDHTRRAWVLLPILRDQFVTVMLPQMCEDPEWFQDTADAVHQNLDQIEYHAPELCSGVRRRPCVSHGRAPDAAALFRSQRGCDCGGSAGAGADRACFGLRHYLRGSGWTRTRLQRKTSGRNADGRRSGARLCVDG